MCEAPGSRSSTRKKKKKKKLTGSVLQEFSSQTAESQAQGQIQCHVRIKLKQPKSGSAEQSVIPALRRKRQDNLKFKPA
jgi:hypothetical protein